MVVLLSEESTPEQFIGPPSPESLQKETIEQVKVFDLSHLAIYCIEWEREKSVY